jgi:hypothetical protein
MNAVVGLSMGSDLSTDLRGRGRGKRLSLCSVAMPDNFQITLPSQAEKGAS